MIQSLFARLALFVLLGCISATELSAQQLTIPPNGGNKKASVSEQVGLTQVEIKYDRPAVNGREGKIWGQVVAYGFNDMGFNPGKPSPWRAGANENTTIEFSTPVTVEEQELPAGKYGFHIAAAADECTLIFSKDNAAWGSYFYDPKNDVLRVKVKPVVTDQSVERLKYEFSNQTENSAVVSLLWEKWQIPFKLEVDYVKTQLEVFRQELKSHHGFESKAYQQAAQFCSWKKTNLDEALVWAESAISMPYIGEKNFSTLSTKSQVLAAMNRTAEADALMKEALPLGTLSEVNGYARQLLAQKKSKEAFDAFKLNFDKHPTEFTAMVGMGRGYAAISDNKKAAAILQKAIPLAPDTKNKENLEAMVRTLKEGKDIN